MAETSYNYSVNDDFPSGKINVDRFKLEIEQSAIIIALADIKTKEVDTDILVTIKFKDELPPADKTILDGDTIAPCGGLIGAHSGEPLTTPQLVRIDSPIVEDDTPVFASNTWPLEHNVVWCGEGDDVDNGVVGGGSEFSLEKAEVGDATQELQFVEAIRLGGGHVYWRECELGDHASFLVFAPATSNIVNNPGAGAYAKLPIGGGINMIVMPGVPGSDGPNWDIDLAEKLNANVDFTKAVPVPAVNGDGFFTYNVKTKALSYTPGTGTHNLFDADIPLSMFIRKLRLIGEGNMPLTVYDNVPACILPQWKSRVTLHRENATGISRVLVWSILLSRLKTV